ncbi:hypothetical protein RF11_04223 [Thelohanellus kitauei]|uniref:Uncharacterized protein n=1 Tax=Thelohanellus kitauei TaxID=669202 RepID=A0A0C2JIH3_THEKT|nr:hypothetical protein RF11_04223 [Thelohanellus kitauei]
MVPSKINRPEKMVSNKEQQKNVTDKPNVSEDCLDYDMVWPRKHSWKFSKVYDIINRHHVEVIHAVHQNINFMPNSKILFDPWLAPATPQIKATSNHEVESLLNCP